MTTVRKRRYSAFAPGTAPDRPASAAASIDGVTPIFVYLQFLDFFTTVIGFRVGAAEASPFVRILLAHAGTGAGIFTAKSVALTIGGICVRARKLRLIRWMTYFSAGLVLWNLMVILRSTGAR